MSVFRSGSAAQVDRIAAAVGGVTFLLGLIAIAIGATAPAPDQVPTAISTTVASTPIPGDPVTMTVLSTEPPTRSTNPPRITQDVTVTEGAGSGSVVVTTTDVPAVAVQPFLGSAVAVILVQLGLLTLLALFLAFATQRVLLGEYGFRRVSTGGAIIGADEAAGVKHDVASADETADLSRPLFEKAPVPDPRLRLLQSRIALELAVRKLAADNDLPSGLSMPYVVRDLVAKKKMSDRLASAVVDLGDLGDRLGHGAEVSPDALTLLSDSYAQALAKVGGKIKVTKAK